MKPTAPLALALCLTLTASAQQTFPDPANLRGERISPSDGHELPIDQGASGLQQLLRRLNTRASILNIVAHPDDEDGGMLTLYSRGLGARVTDLSLTRGEGGQNFVTADFEDALGLIRTQELLANDRYTGVTQLFGTEVDFGFSKTKEESFAKWTHDRVLYDAVRAIRLVRPLVITATFIGNVTDGHGQHQVSGEIAQEAFKAAADPSVFPDQIAQGLLPWQALKVYARVPFAEINSKGVFDYATGQYVPARFTNYVSGKVTTTKPPADVNVPEGTTDPLLTTAAANSSDIPSTFTASPGTPLSYAQFSRIGLGLQRTQISKNMRLPVAGSYDSGYTLYGSALPTTSHASSSSRPGAPSSTRAFARQGGLSFAVANDSPPQPHLQRITLTQPQTTRTPLTDPTPTRRSMHSTTSIDNPNLTTPTFFTGIDTSIEGIATLAPTAPIFLHDQLARIAEDIAAASHAFDPHLLAKSAPSLSDALQTTNELLNQIPTSTLTATEKANVLHELRIKQVQLNDALVLSLGLTFDATAPAQDFPAGTAPQVSMTVHKTSSLPAALSKATVEFSSNHEATNGDTESWSNRTFKTSAAATTQIPGPTSTNADITRSYFTRENIEQPVYKLLVPDLRNAPATPWPLTAWASVSYDGAQVRLGRIVHSGSQPISIIPPVSIASAPTATVLPTNQTTAQLTATLATAANTSANINVQSPRNWSIEAKAAAPNAVTFFLHPNAPLDGPLIFHVSAQTPDHHAYTEGFRPVGYPGLILTNYYTPAITRVVPVDLKLPAHVRIAYLPGTGDGVPQSLASVNLALTMITVADLTPTTLANFDTVILGVRAYTAHPDLHGAPTTALLDFARSGGNVLVQYQSPDFTSADAPYPLSLGTAEKVIDETAPVQILTPNHAQPWTLGPGPWTLLSAPNQITSADFNNWIEERGHGFLNTWDPHYTPLTETHDPAGDGIAPQLPQRGGLLTTSVGKGHWTYCAFALYRQLPEAVPGAFRLFVNLLTPTP
jgi:LmbE family N-acetylglucosaminyl deacetylase